MNSKILITLSLLLLPGLSIVHAQDKQNPPTAAGIKQQPEQYIGGAPEDPKLSAEQKTRVQSSGMNNPSKPPTMAVDPKLTTIEFPLEKDNGETNAKPKATKNEEDILKGNADKESKSLLIVHEKPAVIAPSSQAADSDKQPAGKTVKGNLDFRKIQAPDDQPKPANTVKVTSYRDYKGPDDQPKSAQPGK